MLDCPADEFRLNQILLEVDQIISNSKIVLENWRRKDMKIWKPKNNTKKRQALAFVIPDLQGNQTIKSIIYTKLCSR
jgi:hypothetical protein